MNEEADWSYEEDADSGVRVEWDEVKEAARIGFNIWGGQPELAWARLAWSQLAAAGLTTYQDDLSRHGVLLRFIALAQVYCDFCEMAWQESTELRVSELADLLSLQPFRMGQMVGPEFSPEENEEGPLVVEAIQELIRPFHDEVTEALLEQAGSPTQVFVPLWLSSDGKLSGVPYDDLDGQVVWEAVNHVTEEKLAGFGWVDQGMPWMGSW